MGKEHEVGTDEYTAKWRTVGHELDQHDTRCQARMGSFRDACSCSRGDQELQRLRKIYRPV